MAAAQSTGISVRFADRGMSGARYESAIDLSALRSATDALYRYASAGWPSGRVGAATFRKGWSGQAVTHGRFAEVREAGAVDQRAFVGGAQARARNPCVR